MRPAELQAGATETAGLLDQACGPSRPRNQRWWRRSGLDRRRYTIDRERCAGPGCRSGSPAGRARTPRLGECPNPRTSTHRPSARPPRSQRPSEPQDRRASVAGTAGAPDEPSSWQPLDGQLRQVRAATESAELNRSMRATERCTGTRTHRARRRSPTAPLRTQAAQLGMTRRRSWRRLAW